MTSHERDDNLRISFLKYKISEGCSYQFVNRCDSIVHDFFDYCYNICRCPLDLNFYDASSFRRYLLRHGLNEGTVNGYISIVRVFYNFLVFSEVVEINPFRYLTSLHVMPIDPPYIPMGQMKRIFQSLENGLFLPIHQIAIFECLYATGINGVELMYMRTSDIRIDIESLVIRGTKRKNQREVPIPAQSMYVLKHYINYRKLHFPTAKYFIVTRRGCKLYYKVLNQAITNILSGTSVKQKGTSVIKNTYRKHLLSAGVKMQTVGLLTGKRMQAIIRHDGWKSLGEMKMVHRMYHPKS